jgi:hypothetical protein
LESPLRHVALDRAGVVCSSTLKPIDGRYVQTGPRRVVLPEKRVAGGDVALAQDRLLLRGPGRETWPPARPSAPPNEEFGAV